MLEAIILILICAVFVIVLIFCQALGNVGISPYSPSQFISDIFRKKSDKAGDEKVIAGLEKIDPADVRTIGRLRTVCSGLFGLIMFSLLIPFWDFDTFYSSIVYALCLW